MLDGQSYTDEQLREVLSHEAAGSSVVLELSPEIAPDRRAAIEQIVAEMGVTVAGEALPPEPTP